MLITKIFFQELLPLAIRPAYRKCNQRYLFRIKGNTVLKLKERNTYVHKKIEKRETVAEREREIKIGNEKESQKEKEREREIKERKRGREKERDKVAKLFHFNMWRQKVSNSAQHCN